MILFKLFRPLVKENVVLTNLTFFIELLFMKSFTRVTNPGSIRR